MSIYKDRHWRSFMKASTWRVVATLATILIVFAFTRKPILSLEIGGVEIVIKLILYYLHERVWFSIPFGNRKHPLSSLPLKGPIKKEDLELIKDKLRELGYI